MPYSVNGNTITQSGTDTDLSGLSGIAGVTVNGSQYTLDGLRLEITGSLVMNGYTERLRFINSPTSGQNNSAAQIAVTSTGSFIVQSSKLFDGETTNQPLPVIDFGTFGITFGATAFTGNTSRRHIAADSGSNVSLSGIFTANTNANGLAYAFDGNVSLIDCTCINQQSGTFSGNQQFAFAEPAVLTYQNFKTVGYTVVDRGVSFTASSGLDISHDAEGFLYGGPAVSGPLYDVFDDYNPSQITTYDWRSNIQPATKNGTVVNLRNCGRGLDLSYFCNQGANQNMRLILTNTLQITPENIDFQSVSAKVYATDVDNGNRGADFTPTGQPTIAASGDINYEGEGTSITFEIISGIFNPDLTLDARGVAASADLIFRGISYGSIITTFQPNLTGVGIKTISPIFLRDTKITETNQTLVDAYTFVDTAQKVYDRSVSYLENNYAGESDFLLDIVGDDILLGARSLIVDQNAAIAFDLEPNGVDIRVKALVLNAGKIITTGTVTEVNGSVISAVIIDANGDSALSFSGVDSWSVFLNESDRDTNTNPDDTGTVQDNYRFIFASNTTYYLRLFVSGETILKDITPTSAGETPVSLSTAGILTAQGAVLSNIDTQLGFIGRVVYVDTQATTNGDGSSGSPFNSIDDGINLYNSGVYSFIELKTSIIDPAVPTLSLAGVKIKGGNPTASLFINNVSIQNGELDDLLLSGSQASGDSITIYKGVTFTGNYSNIAGNVISSQVLSLLGQDVTLSFQGSTSIISMDVTNVGQVYFDIGSISVAFRRITGRFNFINMEAGSTCSIDSISGQLTVEATCTGGNLRISDTLEVVDQSDDTTITIEDLPTLQQIEQSTVIAREASLQGVKAKTDQITVSNGNVHADSKRLNGAVVVGDGSELDKWRGQGV